MDHCKDRRRKTNNRERANCLSAFTFWYSLGLFKKGIKKDLEEDDLYETIKTCKSKKCGDETEKAWNTSHSIYRLLWKRFGATYITICVITIAWTEISSILQPYGMSRLISYFEKNQTKISKTDVYQCAGIVIFIDVFHFFFWRNLNIYEFNFCVRIRASLKSLLYRKALKLSPASFSQTNLGNIVTILTKDIHSIEENLWLVMDITIFGIQAVTVSYLLWAKMGNSAFVGLGIMLAALPLQMYLSSLLLKIKLKVGKYSDERLQVTQETLSAIKIIKMYTWEIFFNKNISDARKKEVTILMRGYLIVAIITGVGVLTSKLTFPILILTYVWMGHTTNTEMLFYVLTLFNQLCSSLGIIIPNNLSRIAQFRASFIRLNKLMQAEETKEHKDNSGKPRIKLEDVAVTITDKNIINKVSLSIDGPGLNVITGTVGSGKTTLLKTILQEYSLFTGKLDVSGTVSYASQEPWLFPSSIRQNICFGESYDKKRYEDVLRVCALHYDLSLLENGDETVVADRGINLSKGQQSRINLARAIYKNSDIYLLDDSLTALDGHVQEFIFNECIKKFLRNKICVLVTQNEAHLKQSDNVLVLDQGIVLYSGSFGDIMVKKINGLTAKLKELDKNIVESDMLLDNKSSDYLLETEQQFARRKVYYETKKIGKVDISVYKNYFKLGGGFLVFYFIILLYIIAQTCESYSHKELTKWIDLQQTVLDLQSNFTVNGTIYQENVDSRDWSFNLYLILVIMNTTLGWVKFYALLRFCRRASINIHKIMSTKILNAVMSFFDTHFLGNILNRFSHDLNNIDESLPYLFPYLIGVLFGCGGSFILVATVNWIFLIPSCIFFVILVFIRVGYIHTSRSVKRLEAATRSPLVGHINSSLEGLTTIRAFKAQQILKDEFDRHQDLYTSAILMKLYTMTSFGFFLDLLGSLFTILIIARFIFFEHDISAGNVGLALTQVFMLTGQVQWGIQQWAQLENHMTSVERVLEYTEIKQENNSGGATKHWPREGGIIYENVTLNYESSKESVLKNVSFSVKPKQKVGIVGRTGAGKSSIISTLFRLYDFEGIIWIDGVNISSLSLGFLRKNIAIIPQDPILFTGTIRDNIDPFNEHRDAKIWHAIKSVRITDLVPSLDMPVKQSGSHFSAGQKQLICLARAAVGRCKVVVLDEATANMDAVTDRMLRDVIDDIFSSCTVLTIAHRLNTVLDCDMVMVMSNGELIEYDNPRKLMASKSGPFYGMCRDGGVE